MFLNTLMNQPEYMKIKLNYFPGYIFERYNSKNCVHSDGYVYMKIVKGLYGLKQAAALAHSVLAKLLLEEDYYSLAHFHFFLI